MNRVYKVIFNRVKGRYEVVSELAKNGGESLRSFFLYNDGWFWWETNQEYRISPAFVGEQLRG
ncbi:ESPR domain-containing protein [uncultured Megasphaera sp.]|uniref:ESPR domain-containing protein n=1 Tax=uncultured Megasphaera sp. TaxID=165188 RepID=UPI002592FA84|nr:ESPR domain-containing protein [uncultured Megasphaera sp.]